VLKAFAESLDSNHHSSHKSQSVMPCFQGASCLVGDREQCQSPVLSTVAEGTHVQMGAHMKCVERLGVPGKGCFQEEVQSPRTWRLGVSGQGSAEIKSRPGERRHALRTDQAVHIRSVVKG
jgi:hypothetical protein